jgi:hypothetical protein
VRQHCAIFGGPQIGMGKTDIVQDRLAPTCGEKGKITFGARDFNTGAAFAAKLYPLAEASVVSVLRSPWKRTATGEILYPRLSSDSARPQPAVRASAHRLCLCLTRTRGEFQPLPQGIGERDRFGPERTG